MAKGVFTPVQLAEIQVKLDNMWKDPQNAKFYQAKGETVKSIQENQTASFPELKDPSKEKEVAVKWVDFCDDTAVDTTNVDECDKGSCDTPDPKTKTYELNTFIKDCFSVRQEDYQGTILDMQETIAKGLMSKQKNIIERFNAKAVAFIDSQVGTNPIGDEFTEENPGANGHTLVPKSDFNYETMIPYWIEMLALLRSGRNFILDGRNMFQARILALANQKNADGKLDAELYSMFPYYNDILGFAKAGVANNTYVIDAGALAIVTRTKYPKVPIEYNGLFTDYSQPLPGYPTMGLDVRYFVECTDGSIVHSWKLKLRAGIFANPILCDEGNTGVQGFTRVADV